VSGTVEAAVVLLDKRFLISFYYGINHVFHNVIRTTHTRDL